MVTVVSAQAMPPPTPSKSPQCCSGVCPPIKPSRRVKATAQNATNRPSHCTARKRSDATNQCSTSAAHRGEVYKKTVRREAALYCKPVNKQKNSMENKKPAKRPGHKLPSRSNSAIPRQRHHSHKTTVVPTKRTPA